jgi:hypothetical protein
MNSIHYQNAVRSLGSALEGGVDRVGVLLLLLLGVSTAGATLLVGL